MTDDGDSAGLEARRRRLAVVTAVVAVGWVVADQLSKWWALNALDDRVIDLVWTLRLNLAFNTGMAFSRGEGLGPVIGVVALVVVVAMLMSLRRADSLLSAVAAGMVLGGAVGNLADRLFRGSAWFRGAVVDFIDLQWFPIFNIADIGITVGGVLLVLSTWRSGRTVPA
jgi:signal peptidase II